MCTGGTLTDFGTWRHDQAAFISAGTSKAWLELSPPRRAHLKRADQLFKGVGVHRALPEGTLVGFVGIDGSLVIGLFVGIDIRKSPAGACRPADSSQARLKGLPCGWWGRSCLLEIVGVVFEPLEGVDLVERHTGLEDINEGIAVVGDGFFEESSLVFSWSPMKTRATNEASSAIATASGLNGSAMTPSTCTGVTNPRRLVGEAWPLVRP